MKQYFVTGMEDAGGYFERVNGRTIQQTEQRLLDIYQEFNVHRFNAELPTPLIKITGDSLGMARFDLIDSVPHIYFSPYFSFNAQRLPRFMLHLMCHWYDETHRETFQSKVREIMAADPWLRDELDKARNLAIHDEHRVQAINIAGRLAAKNPDMPWTEARRQIARELKITVRATYAFLENFESSWSAIKNRLP